MNNAKGLTGNVDTDRDLGIDIYYSDKPFLCPNLTRNRDWVWRNEIPIDDPLGVSGTLNAISFTSEQSGTQTIIGRGAGGIETASSILRDLIDIKNEIQHNVETT